MRRLLVLLLCLITFAAKSQWAALGGDSITFDPTDPYYHSLIVIDTTHYHHNIWQIGRPAKTVFTSARSAPNAIVTDTLNPYPVNDTSVFIAKIPARRGGFPIRDIGFYYQLNIDTNAIVKVELSEDSGARWMNVVDTLPSYYDGWYTAPPDLHHLPLRPILCK